MMSQPSRARNAAVTMAVVAALRTGGRREGHQAATAGQTTIMTAPRAVQARCCGVEPPAGSGDAAMPMLASPAMASRMRAGSRTPVRPAAVAR
jgi:hypothetical protein